MVRLCLLTSVTLVGWVGCAPEHGPPLAEQEVVEQTTSPAQPAAAQEVSPADQSRCIVILFGRRYDLTEFKPLHPAEDVFACGTDMTDLFTHEHDREYLELLERFLID